MAASCVKHGYSGRRPAAELLERLRSAPAGSTGTALTEALRDAVLAMVTTLTALNSAIKTLDRSDAAHLGEPPDGTIFTSLPRSGQVNAAQMLAEWGDCRQAGESPDCVAALAGCTPSPSSPASTALSTSDGPATSASYDPAAYGAASALITQKSSSSA
ncbi:MAG: transposase [Streptosporangiaceae bacterium]